MHTYNITHIFWAILRTRQRMLLITCYGSCKPASVEGDRIATNESRSYITRCEFLFDVYNPCLEDFDGAKESLFKAAVIGTLVEDVNEYLSPASPNWYAVRGIPYRRGYLFHGPPGTGKSSLSFALAGLFGLNVHVISLLEPTLTETDLAMLFNNLPKRCIVLLEDIDTAGLVRTDNEDELDSKLTDGTKDDATTTADLLKEVKKAGRRGGGRAVGGTMMDGESNTGISLSGLLNAIDGVASQEGRVLVMTTNHPEKLDPALLRPGRVDMQIAFTLATKHQIREIFSKMYHSSDQPADSASLMQEKTPLINGHAHANGDTKGINGFTGSNSTSPSSSATGHYSKDDIKRLAYEFAEIVPEEKFSPAEVQSFLITMKKDPQRAMDEVEKWRDELVEAKERSRK
ncbi:hypothetical protein Vi05172_g5528 [Venturia inaequalis]|nr:hypothetical protein Vi05172_g5528 [Venturia inaequalis]